MDVDLTESASVLVASMQTWRAARTAWEEAVASVTEAEAMLKALLEAVAKLSKEVKGKESTMGKQKEGSQNARTLAIECELKRESLESATKKVEEKRSALGELQTEEARRSKALDTALAALNHLDSDRRGERGKWIELNTSGSTIFTRSEHHLCLPPQVGEQTQFSGIFNRGFDSKGVPLGFKAGEGGRWHGRKGADGKDAAWVAPYDEGVREWLGGRLNWLATLEGGEKHVVDTHALKAGVDVGGRDARTPAQAPPHADSCEPNSHASARAPWADAHLVMITALQDGTKLPIHPFDKGGKCEMRLLNKGDLLVFRGDLIHFGAEYDKLNIRIHSYIDSPSAPKRDPDRTYMAEKPEEHWPVR